MKAFHLTDFTLDDFRIELLNFLETNRQRLEDAPFGLYAVVPSPSVYIQIYLILKSLFISQKKI